MNNLSALAHGGTPSTSTVDTETNAHPTSPTNRGKEGVATTDHSMAPRRKPLKNRQHEKENYDKVLGVDTDDIFFQINEAPLRAKATSQPRRRREPVVLSPRGTSDEDDDADDGAQKKSVKPRWWFRVRRYYHAASIVSRTVCCLVTLAASVVVMLFHMPIYSSLNALERVHVPAYTAVRYYTDPVVATNLTEATAATQLLPSCPQVGGVNDGSLAIASRHHNGSLDVSGKLHVHCTSVDSETLQPTQRPTRRSVVVPAYMLGLYASNISAIRNATRDDDAALPERAAAAADSVCLDEARQETLTVLRHSGDPLWANGDDAAAPWKRVASLNCAAITAAVLYDPTTSEDDDTVSQVVVLCRCHFVALPSSSSDWMQPALLTTLLAQQRGPRFSMYVLSLESNLLISDPTTLGEAILEGVTDVKGNSLTIHADQSDLTNTTRVVMMSVVGANASCRPWAVGARGVATSVPIVMQVVVAIAADRAALEVTGVPLLQSHGRDDGDSEWGFAAPRSAPSPYDIRSMSVVVTPLLSERVSSPEGVVVIQGNPGDTGGASTLPRRQEQWNASNVLLVVVVHSVGGRGGAQELRVLRLEWNLSFVATTPIGTSSSSSNTGDTSSVAVETAVSSSTVLIAVPLPAVSGLCCGAQPLQLLSGAMIRPDSSVTSTELELFLLGYRDCPMHLSQCVQTSTFPSTAQTSSSSPLAYTSKLVAVKYSLAHNVLSAVLPLSVSDESSATALDTTARATAAGATDMPSVSANDPAPLLVASDSGAHLWSSVQAFANGNGVVLVALRDVVITATNDTGTLLMNATVSHRHVRMQWTGGYRLDGVVLPSTAVCAATTDGQRLSSMLGIDVAINGRLPFEALLGALPSSTAKIAIGGWLCVGPRSQGVLVANVASAATSGRRSGGVVSGADYCFGHVISDAEFSLW